MQGNNSKFIEECRSFFLEELEQNYYWRVFRLSTFKDLIFSKITKYVNTSLPIDKVDLVNVCIKGLIIQKLGQMDSSDSTPEEIRYSILIEKNKIIDEYESIIRDVKSKNSKGNFLLSDEKSYLKVLSQIEPHFFPEENIYSILENLL